ncbi:hypothetical protein KM92DES2_11671 [uncultured Desulfovibrio sp.]|uniref:Uncharacterized protein n=2 Tax=Desulfovibrio TaxID=872 RepID=A0A212JT82_9BACT|nr:hypothetical protein KM92DES2_11671 [uncultured Desulfovibrio sp.]
MGRSPLMSDGRPELVCCQPVSEAYADSLIGCQVQIFSHAGRKDSFFHIFLFRTKRGTYQTERIGIENTVINQVQSQLASRLYSLKQPR